MVVPLQRESASDKVVMGMAHIWYHKGGFHSHVFLSGVPVCTSGRLLDLSILRFRSMLSERWTKLSMSRLSAPHQGRRRLAGGHSQPYIGADILYMVLGSPFLYMFVPSYYDDSTHLT